MKEKAATASFVWRHYCTKRGFQEKKLQAFASTKLCVKILPQTVNIHKIFQLCMFGFDKIQVKCLSSCPRKDGKHECFTCKYFLNPSGDYNCEAESALGLASVTHHLLVLLDPHPPTPRCERSKLSSHLCSFAPVPTYALGMIMLSMTTITIMS